MDAEEVLTARKRWRPGRSGWGPPVSLDELRRVGRLIRELRDAMESFQPPSDASWQELVPDPAGGDLICHNDLAPWNLVRNDHR